jgi:hypothetical protein
MYYTQHTQQRELLTGLKYILHLSVLIIMTLFVFIFYQTVFALSPSFPIQGIILHADNWQLNSGVFSTAKNITQCKEGQQHIRFPNIQAVSYYSDGKTLFATLWLSSKFKDIDNAEQHRSYAFFIVSDSVYNANQSYEVSVDWNFNPNSNNPWIKKFHEWSPIPGFDKVLYQENITSNHPGFFEREKNYVDLSMDLRAVGYPDKYSVVSYATETFTTQSGPICSLVDITDAVHVPPPEFILSTIPNSVVLRPGEENKIELELKSNTTVNSNVMFSTEPIDGLDSAIIPKEISVSPFGVATSTLYIKALGNAISQPHTLRINANITIPIKVINLVNGKTSGPSLNIRSITKNTDFIVTVQPPLTISEQINNFITNWFNPLTGVYSTIATIATGILGWRIGKRQKDKQKIKNI